jgi:hypothetical protein
MHMKKLFVISGLLVLSACVTINIYFPAAEAQKAADKIIDEVWQLKNSQKPDTEKVPEVKPAETPESK